jgi:hypothetical protein
MLSTSNCGNPARRLFGFGLVTADEYGLGYIIKDDGLPVSVYASKHLQTRRFLDTLQGYLEEVQRILVALVHAANDQERPELFIDCAGVLRDSKIRRRIYGNVIDDEEEVDCIRYVLYPSSVLPFGDGSARFSMVTGGCQVAPEDRGEYGQSGNRSSPEARKVIITANCTTHSKRVMVFKLLKT